MNKSWSAIIKISLLSLMAFSALVCFVAQKLITILEKIKSNLKNPFVYDSTGEFSLFFKHSNNDKKYYSIYFVDQSLKISKF